MRNRKLEKRKEVGRGGVEWIGKRQGQALASRAEPRESCSVAVALVHQDGI